MRHAFKIAAVLAMLAFQPALSAKGKSDPEGFLTYSLPSTVIVLEVEAVQERFYAGPYAKYAEKYLGIKARQKDKSSLRLTQIRMVPFIEADQSRRYSVNVKKGQLDGTFFKLSSGGFVSLSGTGPSDGALWRFAAGGKGDFSGMAVSSNVTSESATLYRSGRKESPYENISVRQDMLVGKSPEQKAAETAQMIIRLRSQRLQIVTGDTDATYSGEAMGAAIAEITRLENEYMTLFTGYTDSQTQEMRFEVVPQAGDDNRIYVAFRMSDTAGLVPADNLSGKPVIMEVIPQEFAAPVLSESDVKKKKGVLARYRIPAVCSVRLMDGADLLMHGRIPVFQLGQESSLPVNVILK